MSVPLRCLICSVAVLVLALSPLPVRSQEQTPQPPSPEQPPAQQQAPGEPELPAGPSTAPDQGQLLMPEQQGAAKPEPPAAPVKTEAPGIYIIKEGDTLWDISNALLKDPFLWPLLWKANPSITNPDLIYPGNKLTIPSLAPIERAMERPGEAAEEAAVEEKAPETAARPPKRPVTPAQPAPEEAPARPKMVLPEEAPAPLMDKYSMLSAGFINSEESEDRIVGSLEPKTIFGYDDVLFAEIHSQETVNVGDRFLIYKALRNIKHPVTGSNYGTLIKPLGILQITKVPARDSSDPLTGRVTISFGEITRESLLTPYQEPSLVYPVAEKRSKDIAGYILEVLDGRTINAQQDIVYLDKGTADGVEPGDRFIISVEADESGKPNKVVGEVQVFIVKENTATAVVRKSTDTLTTGDMVEFKK